jgi:hypothetical protein
MCIGYKPLHHVTVLKTAGNYNTIVSTIIYYNVKILLDHRRICGSQLTKHSLFGRMTVLAKMFGFHIFLNVHQVFLALSRYCIFYCWYFIRLCNQISYGDYTGLFSWLCSILLKIMDLIWGSCKTKKGVLIYSK